ncbi:uncharacterized protein FOMMEDRAFT_55907, partial [Fomitiporia mediterranea MF3/22]|uniref:uncharacterized protein n=1 Tax=Fomitiporia mediterranea (strain MF3/22) TaxID=694068 RepID=UPI00044079C0
VTAAAYSVKLPYASFCWMLQKCVIGSFLMRSAACTINDIIDRNVDSEVGKAVFNFLTCIANTHFLPPYHCTERTKNRPIASGRISVSSAIAFFAAQVLANALFFSTLKSTASCLYPILKRVTYWPQAWLGVAINFGFLVTWLEIVHDYHSATYPAVVMMIGLWCWTLLYDTVYGSQDRIDDRKVGIWSTSLLFEGKVKFIVYCLAMCFLCILSLFGIVNNHGLPYFAISVGGTAAYIIRITFVLNETSPKSCW